MTFLEICAPLPPLNGRLIVKMDPGLDELMDRFRLLAEWGGYIFEFRNLYRSHSSEYVITFATLFHNLEWGKEHNYAGTEYFIVISFSVQTPSSTTKHSSGFIEKEIFLRNFLQ